jgi:arsenate reductase-like glutaredoxin family protein
MKRDADAIFSESKKKAQEAILRLWPLNIRYHNFVEEGIDRSLLDELFTELGLDFETTIASQEQLDTSTVSNSTSALSNAQCNGSIRPIRYRRRSSKDDGSGEG